LITEIGEPIVVAAVFRDNLITPRAFLWRTRRYRIEKIMGHYHYFKGVYRQECYSASCGADDVFEISFDTEDMSWRLERVHVEG